MTLRYSPNRRQAEFTAWISPHLEALYRTAWRFTGHPQDAEDLVQELLLRLYQKSADRLPLENPGSWLLRALHNQFVDQWRRRRNQPLYKLRYLTQAAIENVPQQEVHGPEGQAEAADMHALIHTALLGLPPEQRAILVLHDVEGHTLEELTVLLRLPLGTVKSRLFRGRRSMRRALAADGNFSGGSCVLNGEMRPT